MIVLLLIVIIVILLFGAATVKAATAKGLMTVAAIVLLAMGWSALKAVPVEAWLALGAIVALGVGVIVFRAYREDGRVREGHRAWQQKMRDDEDAHLKSLGLTEEEIARYQQLLATGEVETATSYFMECAGRVASRNLAVSGNPADDARYANYWAAKK